ncbi:MAG: tripartite tricarboxylate transporter TctB family protein [Boseongicola sp.]
MLRIKENLGIIVEWAVWMALALIAYNINYVFDKPIEGYRYGATGWPRAVLIAIMVGATFQVLFQYLGWEEDSEEEEASGKSAREIRLSHVLGMLAVFAVPFIYLWLLPRTGFYLTTPFFIVAYMAVLNVRSWKPFVFVTATVYGLLLLIFTRLFYVALPVGSWQPFYDINNAIIVGVRAGM